MSGPRHELEHRGVLFAWTVAAVSPLSSLPSVFCCTVKRDYPIRSIGLSPFDELIQEIPTECLLSARPSV